MNGADRCREREKRHPSNNFVEVRTSRSLEDRFERRSRRALLRRRCGSITLMLCLLATPLLMILSTYLIGLQRQTTSLDLERALSAQVRTRLAGFRKPLFDEYGLLAIDTENQAEAFSRMLPSDIQEIPFSQTTGQPLSDPVVLKNSILSFMRLRLPASALKTILVQSGIQVTGVGKTYALTVWNPVTPLPLLNSRYRQTSQDSDHAADTFAGQVQETVRTMLQEAIEKALGDDIREALSQYRRFVAECTSGEAGDTGALSLPDLFNPSEISRFASFIGKALTVPGGALMDTIGVREYILWSFWPAGVPSQAIQALPGSVLVTGDHLLHRNLSGHPLKDYSGRKPGEVEQILTGAATPDQAIRQVKSILVVYRAAVYLFRQSQMTNGMNKYRAMAAGVATVLAGASSGTILVDPEIIAYFLLVCDALRQGFADYSSLMRGARLNMDSVVNGGKWAMDYPMHLRILVYLTPERHLLPRIAAQISQRHSGQLDTWIQVSCDDRGREISRQGSLLSIRDVS